MTAKFVFTVMLLSSGLVIGAVALATSLLGQGDVQESASMVLLGTGLIGVVTQLRRNGAS